MNILADVVSTCAEFPASSPSFTSHAQNMVSTQKQNIVIVGGGVSGITVAQGLSKKLDHSKFNLILIEPRPHHVWLPATARMVVTSNEKFAETVVFPFDRVFAEGKGIVKQDKVVSIKEGKDGEASELELASGEVVQYRGEHTCPPPSARIHLIAIQILLH